MTLTEKYIHHLEACFEKAYRKESKLIQEVHDIPGMTGEMTRHFYNNLLELDDARYLEIGVWSGSSSCSLMYANHAKGVMIDNFSSFGSPKETFLDNFEKYRGDNDVVFLEADCFQIDLSHLENKFNIFIPDGDHSDSSHYKYIEHYLPCMQDIFIAVVDDWNWSSVRNGTMRGIEKFNLEVLYKKEIRLTNNDEHTPAEEAARTWHNGIGVFVLKKTTVSQEVENKFQELCRTPSDINIHLPILRQYADQCNHVTEMGVRGCVSLYAFLSSKAKKVVAVDILNVWTPSIEKLQFICADDLEIEIEQTDMLFIDSKHCADQLRKELSLHAGKVNKYIACHDTAKNMFGINGDDGGQGLLYAIDEFLINNPKWSIVYRTEVNNGLLIMEKK